MILLQYSMDTNGPLATGMTDTVIIDVSISAPGLTNDVKWPSMVSNNGGTEYLNTAITPNRVQDVDIIEKTARANAGILPGNIYSTEITNNFDYTVENIGNLNDRIYRLKIMIPAGVTNIFGLSSILLGTNAISVDMASNFILIDYDSQATFVSSGNYDIISFSAMDNMDAGTNLLFWDSEADFFNGLGYLDTETGWLYSKYVSVLMPDPIAEGYIEPEEIFSTSESNLFTYIITNKGFGTDRILKARIFIPSGFTQVSLIQSSILSNDGVNAYVSNNYILLDYEAEGQYIGPRNSDTITFIAHDNITSETSYVFASDVNNHADIWNSSEVYPLKTQAVDIIIPFYAARAYIDPNQVESTVTTNHIFTLPIENISESGNDILRAEIYMPLPEFTTNGLSVSSSMISNSYITLLSNRIILDYQAAGSPVLPGSFDVILIKIYDTLSSGWASVTWDVKCEFNTSFGKYIDTGINFGRTKDVAIVMPDAEASAYIEPTSILTSETNRTFTYRVINEGDGSNDITEAKIYVNTFLFTITGLGFVQSSHISNDAAWALHSGGVVTLQYAQDIGGSLATGVTDIVTINVSIAAPGPTNDVAWPSRVTNDSGPSYAYAAVTIDKHQDIDILAPDCPVLFVSDFYPKNGCSGDLVTIIGGGFTEITNFVWIGGEPVNIFTRWDDSVIEAVIPADSKTGPVTVMNHCGNSYTAASNLIVPKVIISSFSPSQGYIGDTVTIRGSGFGDTPGGGLIVTTVTQDLFNDDFESGDFSKWFRTNNSLIETNSPLAGNYSARITNAGQLQARWINSLGYTNLKLVYTVDVFASVFDDFLRVDYSYGGGSWMSLPSIHPSDPIGPYTNDLDSVVDWKVDVRIRFRERFDPGEYAIIDNVKVIGEGGVWSNMKGGIVVFNNVEITNFIEWSDTNIVVQVPAGATTGPISVTNILGSACGTKFTTVPDFTLLVKMTKALGGIIPNSIYSTDITNNYTYTITNNSSSSQNNSIYNARIKIPPEVTNIYNLQSMILTNTNSIFVDWASNYIRLDYASAGTNIRKNQKDVILFTAIDNMDNGTNLLFWNTQVNFSNGFGFVDTETNENHSKYVSVLMPDPDTAAYIQPELIYTTSKSNIFTYVISNRGFGTDRILGARIVLPAGFTQASGISSSILSNDALYAYMSNNYIVLDYVSDGRYIPGRAVDTVFFLGHDNITSENSYIFTSEVYNYPTDWYPASVWSNTQTVESKIPGFSAKAHIEPEEVESTVVTNHIFTIPVENTSLSGNDILRVEIYIPLPEFSTNSISVSSSVISNKYISISGDRIRLDYQAAGLPMGITNFDNILVSIYDTLTDGWGIVTWAMKCEFNTSFGQYIDTGIHFGKSKDVAFIMPDAQASAYIEPSSLYTIETNKVFIYSIINQGTGENSITEAKIYVPDIFSNINPGGISSEHISNDAAWIGYSSGVITLMYSMDTNGSLTTSMTDRVMIDLSFSISGPTNNIIWRSQVTNNGGPSYANTVITSNRFQDVDIIEPTFQADSGIVPNSIYSTDITNSFVYTIENTSTSINDRIYYGKIIIPAEVTNIFNVQSLLVTNVNSMFVNWISNFIFLDYTAEGTNIMKNEKDQISFTAIDNMDTGVGTNTIYWEGKVNFSNNVGYLNTGTGGYSKDVSIMMPVPDAAAYIVPAQIYTTMNSNIFTYILSNRGLGTDRILGARITIPSGFTQISRVLSSIISNDAIYASVSNNYIWLDYEGDSGYIPPGTSDTITFTAYDNIILENSFVFSSEVYNTPEGWQASSIHPFGTMTVDTKIPGWGTMSFIEPNQIDSTTVSNHIFNVMITNIGQAGNEIIHADIFIPLPEFTTNSISVSSSVISNSFITVFSDRIRLDYQAAGLSITPADFDTVLIKIYDTMTFGWANVTWDIKCEYNTSLGFYIDTGTVPAKSKNVAIVMPAALASAYIEPTSLLASETNKTFTYRIINEGTGENSITEAKIYVPGPIFTNIGPGGFVLSSHIAGDASWAQYSGGVITLRYAQDINGPLVTGQTDTILIDVSVSAFEDTNNIFWYSQVTNNEGPSYPYTAVTTNKLQDVDITAIIAKARAGIMPDNIYSTAITNNFTYTISNNSATVGSNEIYLAMIIIPPEVTNIYNIQSLLISDTNNIIVNWASNFILFDYTAENTNIDKNQKDVITFTAIDSLDSNYTNIRFLSRVYFSNAGGWKDAHGIQPDFRYQQ